MSYEIYERIRNKAGYKDADVSRETGITKSTFSEWRKGTYTPKEDKRKKIAEFLGVSLEYQHTFSDERKSIDTKIDNYFDEIIKENQQKRQPVQ